MLGRLRIKNLLDFGIFGAAAGIDYPEDWEPAGDDWMMDLRYGGCDPEYSGIAEL